MEDRNKEIFSFEARDITTYMMHKLRLKEKFFTSFNYLVDKIGAKKIPKDLGKMKWSEGKNYDWMCLKEDDVTLLIRKYRHHFTIFFKHKKTGSGGGKWFDDFYHSKHGCFTFETDTDKLKTDEEKDSYCDDNFKDLNRYMKSIIELIKEDNIHSLWNSLSFKLEEHKNREDHIKVKNVWNGYDDISSIDTFIFACEELFHKYLELFSTNEMLEKIKTIKKGDMLGVYKVTEVRTKVKDDYYHDAGLSLQNTNFKNSKSDWSDVYSLTRYYYEYVFGTVIKEEDED